MKNESDPNLAYDELKRRVELASKPVDPIYKRLAARLGAGEWQVLIQMLALLANLEQAKLIEALPDPHRPASTDKSLEITDKFAESLGISRETADKHIQELYEKGVVFPTKKGPNMARTFIQLKDASAGNPKFDEQLGKAFFDLCAVIEGPMRKPLPEDMRLNFHMRVVPRWRSIESIPGVLPFEDTRAILKSHNIYALVPCGCKRGHADRWCDVPVDSCIALGGTARYNLDRGVGRRLTYEEALGILDKLDEYPTVHTTVNQREVNQLICNCHYCCCATSRMSASSRFIAENSINDCIGCGDCVDKCQYSAIVIKTNPGIDGEAAFIDPEACRGCGSCVVTCSASSLHMKLVRPPEHIPENFSIY